MANAKLWWDGSNWSPSETYWQNFNTLQSLYCGIIVKLQIIAYDDGTIRFYGHLGKTSPSDEFFEGSKNIYVDGTKYVYSNSNTTVDVSGLSTTARVYTTGSLACYVSRGGRYNGNPWSSNHDTTITDPFCTVTFNANGGSSAPSPQTVCKGASCALTSSTPTKTGYTFLGWSSSSTATTATYPAGGTITASGDTVLYAVWQANSFNLTITKPATASFTILKNGSAFTGNTVNYDDVLTITATASPGYRILSLTLNGSDFTSGSTHTVTGDVAIVATTIAQSSTIATYDAAVLTLDTFSLTVNRYSDSHYNKLRYYDSNSTLLYTSAVFTESTSLTIPQSWFTNFGSVTSITITAVLTTYTDPECTTVTGVTDTCTFTVTADSSMKPTLTSGCVTFSPVNPNPGPGALSSPGFVKGYSKVQAVFDTSKITHAVGASAASYAISFQGVSTSGSSTTILSSNILNAAGSITVSYTVTDSRGRSTTATQTISVNDYSNPAIASLNCFRSDSLGDPDDDEPYMAVTASCSFTQLSNNAITITVEVKPTGGSYTSYGTLTNATKKVIGGSFLADTSYYVKVTVTDSVGNSAYTEMSMPRRTWDFHVRHTANGPGAAFGKVTENDLALQLANGWKFMMDDTVMTESDLIYLLSLDGLIGNTALPTTAQTITGAIAEIAGGSGGGVTDVEVDGTSVVTGGVAQVDLTGKSDVGHTHTVSDITDMPAAGISMKLLWTNPNPTTAYSATTEAIDLSGYDAVLIKTLNDRTSNTPQYHSEMVFIGDSSVCYSSNASTTGYTYKRQADVSSSGITFGGGYRNTSASNNYAIPQKIYGIKGIT